MLYHPEKGKVVLKNTGNLKINVVFCLQIGLSVYRKLNIKLHSRLLVDGLLNWSLRPVQDQCEICDEQCVAWTFFLQILGFPLPLSFHKCSIFIFLYMIILPEGKSPKLRTCQRISLRQTASIEMTSTTRIFFYVYGSAHHNIFYEITNRYSYMQSILFHC